MMRCIQKTANATVVGPKFSLARLGRSVDPGDVMMFIDFRLQETLMMMMFITIIAGD